MPPRLEEVKSNILLPRSIARPVRIRVKDHSTGKTFEYRTDGMLRLGHGKDCEIFLPGGPGPEVLLELEPIQGPVKLSSPLSGDELRSLLQLKVDGKVVREPAREFPKGTRIELLDKSSNRRYDITIDPVALWSVRPNFLAGVAVITLLCVVGYGAHLFDVLQRANVRLTETEHLVSGAQREIRDTEQRLDELMRRMQSTEVAFAETISELRSLQESTQTNLREEFDQRLQSITERAQDDLSRLSTEDATARAALDAETKLQIAALRDEFGSKHVAAFQRFKRLEEEVLTKQGARLEAIEQQAEQFKGILASATPAVVFIRTHYQAIVTKTGQTQELTTIGTGFLLEDSGLTVAPQHVLFPWRYERELLVLVEMGLARVQEDSVTWSVWLSNVQVIDADHPEHYLVDNAYQSARRERAVHILYVPEVEETDTIVAAPLGLVRVRTPIPGPTDVVVFQLIDPEHAFPHLTLGKGLGEVDPLDEIMVIGYPLSRLQGGKAVPQAVRGFVRRVSGPLIEVDSSLQSGISGGPVIDRTGNVIGMAIATLASDAYGIAVLSDDIQAVIERARMSVRLHEERLVDLGCAPGKVDGRIDHQSWQALLCEAELTNDGKHTGAEHP